MDPCKSLVDDELMYNLSSLDNCDKLYLLISDGINMALIHSSYTNVILFLLLTGFMYVGMYLLSDVYPIHTFSSTVLAPKHIFQILVISYN